MDTKETVPKLPLGEIYRNYVFSEGGFVAGLVGPLHELNSTKTGQSGE